MSWENNIYEPEVKPSRPKKGIDPMVALALTSKRWEKNRPSDKAGFSNLPPELRTKIYEYLEKPAPPVLKGRRRPGTVFREPRNFLTRRRMMKEIPEKAASFNKRRGTEMVEKLRRQIRRQLQAEQALIQSRREAQRPPSRRLSSPLRSSALRRLATAKSRARRGAEYNFGSYALPKTRSKKPSKATRKLRAIARKQNSKAFSPVY
jgi:hypothetical protein